MLRTATLTISFTLLFLVGAASADVVVLRNGRKLEGEIVKSTPQKLKLRLSWGVMTIPKSRIKSVTQQASAKTEFLTRLKKTDMKDSVAVTKLAQWAAKRGLGQEARDLGAQSLHMRYEQRIAAAAKRKSVDGWIETYHWARTQGVSHDRQLYALERARGLAPRGDLRVRVAFRHFRGDVAAAERRLRKIAEVQRRPRYAMMKDQTYVKRNGQLTPISGKVTLKSMMKPDANRKKLLERLARYRRAAQALEDGDPRDRVKAKDKAKPIITRVKEPKAKPRPKLKIGLAD